MVKQVLRGDLRPVRRYLEQNMQAAAAALKFEAAQRYKQRIEALESYQSRSVIVSAKIIDCDVFSLLEDDDVVYCNFIRLRHGSVVALHTVKLSPGVETSRAEMLTMAIQYVVDNISHDLSREVIVPLLPSTTLLFDKVVFTVPKRGEKAELLEFSLKSARIYRAEQMKNLEIKNPERHTERLMNAMQRELHLDRQPRHIECFDNSNLQGTNPVASCVVFRDGRPSRKEYRHFNIKTVVGADDFASMREIVRRRYTRLLEEGAELPDLIIVDGGKGQLSSAYEVLWRAGYREACADRGPCQAYRGDILPGRPDALLPEPHGRAAEGGVPHTRRGAPFRHHVPPPEAKQRLYRQRAGTYKGHRYQERERTDAPLPHDIQDKERDRGRAGGDGGGGACACRV